MFNQDLTRRELPLTQQAYQFGPVCQRGFVSHPGPAAGAAREALLVLFSLVTVAASSVRSHNGVLKFDLIS